MAWGPRPKEKPVLRALISGAVGADMKALEGSSMLAKLKSVLRLGKEKGDVSLPENDPVQVEKVITLGQKLECPDSVDPHETSPDLEHHSASVSSCAYQEFPAYRFHAVSGYRRP